MNTKNTFLVLIAALFLAPFMSKGQTAINKKANDPSQWSPVVLDKDGGNKIGNVAFFSMKSECSGKEVVLLKILNGNAHSVKIQWQTGPESPVVEEIVPATTDVQGFCPMATDKVKSGLVITNIPQTEAERAASRRYLLSHLKVVDLKN